MDVKKVKDYEGNDIEHGRVRVNGVRLHYTVAGKGAPLLLLHGVPKNWFYYHKIIPALSEHFTVVTPDIRGFGDSEKPAGGYEMENVAKDLVELMEYLNFKKFSIHGEDWGAAFAYAIAASCPEHVEKLCYAEMMLPGYGMESKGALTEENIKSKYWNWHCVFFHCPGYPELLIQGKEREFWVSWAKNECHDPTAIDDAVADEIVRCCSGPEGLRPIFQVYRSTFANIDFNNRMAAKKLTMPVLAIGSSYFIADDAHRQMQRVSDNVTCKFIDCGHSLALEKPQELVDMLTDFFSNA
jgi:pimeloyl-ACP methyl ester carboxylesterase